MPTSVDLRWTRQLPIPRERAWHLVLDRLWRQGAGMPPRPRMLAEGDEHGIGATRAIRTIPGVELIERVSDGRWPEAFRYRVVNPGWRTYPVRWHRGEVTFTAHGPDAVEVAWTVAFEPLPWAGLPARWMTRAVIGRYLATLERAAFEDDPPTRAGS